MEPNPVDSYEIPRWEIDLELACERFRAVLKELKEQKLSKGRRGPANLLDPKSLRQEDPACHPRYGVGLE